MRYVVTCGGTGGHVFPGVATAKALKAGGDEVALILSGRGVEKMSASGWDGEVMSVICPPLRKQPFAVFRAIAGALSHLRRFRPDALLAMGSYASVAPVIAARILRIPVVLHEANAVPGAANRFLSHFAKVVAVAFPSVSTYFSPKTRIVDTGMPTREDIPQPAEIRDFHDGKCQPTLLVMGGSQGARAVNELVVETADEIAKRGRRIKIIHLAGRTAEEQVKSLYATRNLKVEVIGFSNEMGRIYSVSDICVCRSGAASCFELCIAGLPSILIPLPSAARDHQTANAAELAEHGAAELAVQNNLTPINLAERIIALIDDTEKRRSMRTALLSMARTDAAINLADTLRKAAQVSLSASDALS